jgi:hypothetical protein
MSDIVSLKLAPILRLLQVLSPTTEKTILIILFIRKLLWLSVIT